MVMLFNFEKSTWSHSNFKGSFAKARAQILKSKHNNKMSSYYEEGVSRKEAAMLSAVIRDAMGISFTNGSFQLTHFIENIKASA